MPWGTRPCCACSPTCRKSWQPRDGTRTGAYASRHARPWTYYGLFTGSSLTRPVFLSTLQALAAFGLAWLAFVPFWGNHGLWGAYLIFYAGRSFFLLRYWPRLRNAPFFRHDSAALR